MVRNPLTERERQRRPAEVDLYAGLSIDTLRKIAWGAIAGPAFFTGAALEGVLQVDLDTLASERSTPA